MKHAHLKVEEDSGALLPPLPGNTRRLQENPGASTQLREKDYRGQDSGPFGKDNGQQFLSVRGPQHSDMSQ